MASTNNDVLSLLIAERDRLNQAIAVLQGDAAVPGRKRRGRPPGSKNKKTTVSKAAKKTRKISPAARKATSDRMKKYWAQRRKEKAGKG
jgi:hypothetical protein